MNLTPFRSVVLMVFLLGAATWPLLGQVSLADGVKRHLDKLTEDQLPGMAVLIARDGKIAFQGGFGFADLDQKIRVTAETKFRIGSVTKQFTAAAILRLAADGKLALTDTLQKFYPGFPRADVVTLHHLLTHTSGIHSYTNKPEFMGRVTQPIPPPELIAWFRDDPADFAPGAGFAYNNSGYFLLGSIVAQVTGKSFDAYLRETFFAPLGMKNTGVFSNAHPPEGVARGYTVEGDKATPALDWDMSWAGGAGALYSTVGDLFLWTEALFAGRVVPTECLKRMTTPVTLPPGVDGMNYGYGLMMASIKRLPAIAHGGGLNGWSSSLVRLPEQNCTVAVLANAMPPAAGRSPDGVAQNLAAKFLEADIAKLPPIREDAAVDKKSYAEFAGRYDYKGAVITVTAEGERLFAQLTGQPRFEIFPSAPDAFFLKVVDAQMVFQRNEQRAVVAVQHSQGGSSFRAPRVTTAEIKFTPAELDAILGQYQYGPTALMTISRDGDSVFAQLTGQPRFPIFPKSAVEFEWRVVAAKVSFVKDGTGKVTAARHSQNGATFEAPKVK